MLHYHEEVWLNSTELPRTCHVTAYLVLQERSSVTLDVISEQKRASDNLTDLAEVSVHLLQ